MFIPDTAELKLLILDSFSFSFSKLSITVFKLPVEERDSIAFPNFLILVVAAPISIHALLAESDVTQSIASLDDIMEEDGYSHDGGWEAKMRGSYGNDMRRDRRYADDMRRRMDTDQDDREYKRRYAEDMR